ncbi:GNAT family N-acetyltransferase [Algoriphagus antarcticus]|uniref:Aminoglycoside 3-N-acetyltransferase I n=1 Tax=Algoriphagus antarcticus TaxID=238540 RepID=A0A3E0DHW2_9BACT|nr:GNAT family N-acetyltransferase [Algoriphagus antarcticus]REG81353.1 aminoglycoside 3-N-acetyltransferase I [Algoriphagus antarcticus]
MKVEIAKLTPRDIKDFSDLIKVFLDAFEWEAFSLPTETYLQKLLSNKSFLVFVAKRDDKLVGGLTAHVLERYDTEKPSAYIYDIAVLTDHQRKGIGRLLIATLNDFCQKNGFNEVFVQAETEDIHTVNFYRKTPISSEIKATHFTYSFGRNSLQDDY